MKKIIIFLAVIGTIFSYNPQVLAAQKIGFVDMSKILSSYTKAQDITNQVKDQQDEIQKMVTNARNKINDAVTDEEKKALEKTLTEEIQQKNNIFRAEYEKNVQVLQNSIFETVKKVAARKKVDCIFRKDNIMIGGKDLTDEVLAELNK